MASSSCDGCVKVRICSVFTYFYNISSQVWSVESKSALQTLPNMLGKSNDVPNSKSSCGLSFSRCGQWLAVPTEEKVVVLGRSETWEKAKEMKITGLAAGEIVTTTAWDSDGGYILAGTNKVADIRCDHITYHHIPVFRAISVCSHSPPCAWSGLCTVGGGTISVPWPGTLLGMR